MKPPFGVVYLQHHPRKFERLDAPQPRSSRGALALGLVTAAVVAAYLLGSGVW